MKRLLTAAGLLVASSLAVAEPPEAGTLEVYKSPTCGCCEKWADHMRDNGFDVVTHEVHNLQPIKEKARLRPGLGSCHTAFIDGYAIEGHVPAEDVRRLLEQKPDAHGLTVPAMPVGSLCKTS